jgi:hypothetical protein
MNEGTKSFRSREGSLIYLGRAKYCELCVTPSCDLEHSLAPVTSGCGVMGNQPIRLHPGDRHIVVIGENDVQEELSRQLDEKTP